MIRDGRIGIVGVAGCLVREDNFDMNELLALFGRLIVLRCEYIFYSDMFEIQAYSPDFDIVPEGAIPPRYIAIITKDENGEIKEIKLERYKNYNQ